MLAAVRSPRHRSSTGSNYSHSSSSGFESLKVFSNFIVAAILDFEDISLFRCSFQRIEHRSVALFKPFSKASVT